MNGTRFHQSLRAVTALVPLTLSMTEHLSVLAQAEKDPAYYRKAEGILDILFEGSENEVIASVRRNLKEKRESCGGSPE